MLTTKFKIHFTACHTSRSHSKTYITLTILPLCSQNLSCPHLLTLKFIMLQENCHILDEGKKNKQTEC